MSLRLSLISVLATLVGCVTSDLPAEGDAFVELAGPQLHVDSQTAASVLPNEALALKVRYLDANGQPVSGVQVDFALTGVAPGASLAPWRALTDAEGVAGTQLSVGSMPGSVEVRAGTHAAPAVYMRVQVREALPTQLGVRVAYAGTRAIDAFTVTALPETRCEEALERGVAGDVVHRFSDPAQKVTFALMPAADTALVAWARDERGGQLARGCATFSAPVSDSGEALPAEIAITLDDTPLRIEGTLPLSLRLDLSQAHARIARVLDGVVTEALASAADEAEAAFYLDALAKRLAVGGVTLHDARGALAARLTSREVGLREFARRVSALLEERGTSAQLRLKTTAVGDVTIEQLEALGSDGATTLPLALQPTLALRATLDADAAKLVVAQLRLELGLGAYVRALLDGLQAEHAAGAARFSAELDRAAGCSEVVGPWVAERGLAAAADGAAACLDAVRDLQQRFGAALEGLSPRPLVLSGSLQARDRTEDGNVDDLGPGMLSGSWFEGDAVSGEVHVPKQDALVL